MKGKKPLSGKVCNYYYQNFVVIVCFFFSQTLTNLINYSF